MAWVIAAVSLVSNNDSTGLLSTGDVQVCNPSPLATQWGLNQQLVCTAHTTELTN